MIALEAKVVNLDTLRRALREMPTAFVPAVKDGLARVLNGFRQEFLAKTPAHLSRGRRGLASRQNWPVVSSGTTLDDLQAVLFTVSKAAHLLEMGGTVRPVHGAQYLALPLKGARGASGKRLPGYSSPQAARKTRGAVFITYETKKGTKLLLEVRRGQGKGRKGLVAVFALVPSLNAKPILGFFAAWEAHGPDDVLRRLGQSIEKVLRATARGAA